MYVYYCFLNITRDIAMFLIFALNKLASLYRCCMAVLSRVVKCQIYSLTGATHALCFCDLKDIFFTEK